MGRPRMAKPSKWAYWKRAERDLPSKPGYVRHHIVTGQYGSKDSRTTLISRARHAAIHNELRRRNSK